jgi:hypothetical protein
MSVIARYDQPPLPALRRNCAAYGDKKLRRLRWRKASHFSDAKNLE